jgi:hypothetical protein
MPQPATPSLALQQSAVVVRPVASRADRRRFLLLPWRVNARDFLWVPPLLRNVRAALAPSHPFHRHAEVQCYLAWRGSEAVGRVAAIVNRNYIEFYNEPAGFFGLFECDPDPEAARLLLEAAADFVRQRGLEVLRGPVNLSTNEELASPGVLIDGFHRPPCVLMSHNPPYYAQLIESAGFAKAKDTFAYWIADAKQLSKRLTLSLEKLEPQRDVLIRSVEMRRLDEELALIHDIYNEAWSGNWGFIPMTADEVRHLSRQLKPVVDPRLCVIAEVDRAPVGFGLAIPNFNQALKHINGRLFPFGLLRLIWYQRMLTRRACLRWV